MKAIKYFCTLDFYDGKPTFVFTHGGVEHERYFKNDEFINILKRWNYFYRGATFCLIVKNQEVNIKKAKQRIPRKHKKELKKFYEQLKGSIDV